MKQRYILRIAIGGAVVVVLGVILALLVDLNTLNKPHQHSFIVYTEAIAPGCNEPGSYLSYKCTGCNKIFLNDQEITNERDLVISAVGHSIKHHGAVASTCAAEGNYAYYQCERCQKVFADEKGRTPTTIKTIEKLEHTLEAHASVKETCTTDGNIAYYSCADCHGKFIKDAENHPIPVTDADIKIVKTGHIILVYPAIAASCAGEGYKTRYCCTRCGITFTDRTGKTVRDPEDYTIEALEHEYETETKSATCEHEGYTQDRCKHCDDVKNKRDIVPSTGHYYGTGEVCAPTCITNGYTKFTCEDCGQSYIANPLPLVDHQYDDDWQNEDGLQYRECTVCQHREIQQHAPVANDVYVCESYKLEILDEAAFQTYLTSIKNSASDYEASQAAQYQGVEYTFTNSSQVTVAFPWKTETVTYTYSLAAGTYTFKENGNVVMTAVVQDNTLVCTQFDLADVYNVKLVLRLK